MQVGDKLKIVEDIKHNKSVKKRTTIGIIYQITKFNIILEKTTHKVSFNIATFKDERFHFYIEKDSKWIPIKIKITEHSCKQGGGKYA